ncbi:LysR family transcriptional regulator [Methylobacterium nodulans]|uniref:Transcriptional regulator, LysR family n=1 Tax=Methylobacterium nodulans (strain LMG 21967 / CNCM I-2342 / ORS 2060) TaxID=460265 RepID=B8IVT2_METNO|nr:LysR family transcriptional regulator [Methylobacterium nodulans]ACL62522.1 transcriptional regulator, LysR family [Methylobacterium nodulans ORS 2060]
MDTELARTFLAVVSAGNFVGAADRLNVSQSTVSTRIQALEYALGCTLFVRNKSGATLTAAGRRFQRHAATLVRAVEQARQEVGIPEGFSGTIVVGGRIGLWEQFLLHWLPFMQRSQQHLSIRAESGLEPEIMQGLVEGRIDIGVMYTPEIRPGLTIHALFEDRLVYVSTDAEQNVLDPSTYIYVDWGPEFYARHSAVLAGLRSPALTVNIGWLGLQHMIRNGGSAYLPHRIVKQYIDSNILFENADMPEFTLPVYAVTASGLNKSAIEAALKLMVEVSSNLSQL